MMNRHDRRAVAAMERSHAKAATKECQRKAAAAEDARRRPEREMAAWGGDDRKEPLWKRVILTPTFPAFLMLAIFVVLAVVHSLRG